jgi:hypothetical protein
MTNQTEISIREVQQEIGIIFLFLRSSDPDRTAQAAPNLAALIERFRDSAASRTRSGATIYELIIRARENLRIVFLIDALVCLAKARDRATMGKPAAG